MDSGCGEIGVSQKFAHSLEIERKSTDLKTKVRYETLPKLDHCSETLELLIGSVIFKIRLNIADWIHYDIVLRKIRVFQHNPVIERNYDRKVSEKTIKLLL